MLRMWVVNSDGRTNQTLLQLLIYRTAFLETRKSTICKYEMNNKLTNEKYGPLFMLFNKKGYLKVSLLKEKDHEMMKFKS